MRKFGLFIVLLFLTVALFTSCSQEMRLCCISLNVREAQNKSLSQVNIGASSIEMDYYVKLTAGDGNTDESKHYHAINENQWYSIDDAELNSLILSQGRWNFSAIGVKKGANPDDDSTTVLASGTRDNLFINLNTTTISIPLTFETGNGTVTFNYTVDKSKHTVTTRLFQHSIQNGQVIDTEVTSGYLANNYSATDSITGEIPSGSYIVVVTVSNATDTVLIDAVAFHVYKGQTTDITGIMKESASGTLTGDIDTPDNTGANKDPSLSGLKEALEKAGSTAGQDDEIKVVDVALSNGLTDGKIVISGTNESNDIFHIPDNVEDVIVDLNGKDFEIAAGTMSARTTLFHLDAGHSLDLKNTTGDSAIQSNAEITGSTVDGSPLGLDGGTVNISNISVSGPTFGSGNNKKNSIKAMPVVNIVGHDPNYGTNNGGILNLTNNSHIHADMLAIANINPPASVSGNTHILSSRSNAAANSTLVLNIVNSTVESAYWAIALENSTQAGKLVINILGNSTVQSFDDATAIKISGYKEVIINLDTNATIQGSGNTGFNAVTITNCATVAKNTLTTPEQIQAVKTEYNIP